MKQKDLEKLTPETSHVLYNGELHLLKQVLVPVDEYSNFIECEIQSREGNILLVDLKELKRPKTHVIMLSKTFPKTHPKSGQPTGFIEKIKKGEKIHTIRVGQKWIAKIEEVKTGEAVLSVREWTGKPYKSPQVEKMQFTKHDSIGAEPAEFWADYFHVSLGKWEALSVPCQEICEADGLNLKDFNDWFEGLEDSGTECSIIHFTKFRYKTLAVQKTIAKSKAKTK